MGGWSADDIPDLTGRRALVTGANSGLGFRTALELARHGADVVVAARDERRGEDAVARMRAEAPDAQVTLEQLDLADLKSVRAFTERVRGRQPSLDILVNNAGVMAIPHRRTADGFEMQIGTNHLGHFALTGLLLPLLLAAAHPRVVTVSSTAHRSGRIDFDDLDSERRYGKWQAYSQSTLANLLFMRELQRRADAAAAGLTSVAAHPGYTATNLQQVGPRMSGNRVMGALMALGNRVIGQSEAMGALPSLYAATAPDVQGGDYYGPDRLFETRGHPTRVGMSAAGRDDAAAGRLWEVSEQRTGVVYDFGR